MATPDPTTTRWYVYANGDVAIVTDEDMGAASEPKTARFRCVAAGTEAACEAAARLWKS